eukprot:12333986-Alexandrium_andersonii.AAC.1
MCIRDRPPGEAQETFRKRYYPFDATFFASSDYSSVASLSRANVDLNVIIEGPKSARRTYSLGAPHAPNSM